MDKNEYKVIVFDWDGTLKDSQSHIVDGLLLAAREIGKELTPDKAKDIIGLGIYEAIYSLFPDLSESEITEFIRIYREFFYKHLPNTSLFPGTIDMLQNLYDKGFILAVATGMSRAGLNSSMEKFSVGRFFDITKCADETISKPDPLMLNEIVYELGIEKEYILMVGDTEFDLEMAKNAKIDSVGVLCGVHSEERLAKWDPVAILKNTTDITQYIEKKEG